MNDLNNKSPLSISAKIKKALHQVYDRLIKTRGTPKEIAFGFALGIFIGLTPTMGFQMAIAVFLASLLKCSKIAAAAGVWITNPVTAPIIYAITYLIGAKVMGVRNRNIVTDDINTTAFHKILEKTPDFFWSLTIGGFIIGIPLAIIAYYFCFSAVSKYQNQIKEQINKQKEKIKKKREKSRNKRKNK